MRKHTPKPVVKVTGNMNQKDAGAVGKQHAYSERLLAVGAVISRALLGIAALIYAIRWW